MSSAPTGSGRSRRTGRGSARCSRATCCTARGGSPTAARSLLFADIHPEVSFAEDTLRIDMPYEVTADLAGRGLLFVPSAFTWPRPAVSVEPPWQPFLVYPARGIGALWEPGRAAPPAALAALLGARRATVLRALQAPRSTTELAAALDLSPGSVSQHLSVLREAGLVHGHRVGRSVLYVRSPTGESIVQES